MVGWPLAIAALVAFTSPSMAESRRMATTATNSTVPASGTEPVLCFPPDFLFGAATSAYQVEGGFNASGRTPSVWDDFCRKDPMVPCANVASDFYHRYKSDISLAAGDGLTSLRFSVSWTRAMTWNATTQRMDPNPAGLAFYHSLIDELLLSGMEPVLTLYHWDLPLELQTTLSPPGWLNSAMAGHFNEYASLMFREFGHKVKFWSTFNEPASFILTGFAYGYGPPQLGNSTTNAYVVAHNVLLAHATAVDTFKALRSQHVVRRTARIGIVLNIDWAIAENNSSAADLEASERKNQFYLGWFLSPITTGQYPEVMRERVGDRLPNFTLAQAELVRGSYDVLMMNYYTSYLTTDCGSPSSTVNCTSLTRGWETDLGVDGGRTPPGARKASGSIADPTSCSTSSGYPRGYLDVLRFVHSHDKSADILLTENGWCGNETIDNQDQVWYYRTHLAHVHKAMYEEGIPVIGYTAWTLLDGFEWTSYAPRFGLYYVNFTAHTGDNDEYAVAPTELTRVPRAAAKWYASLATTGCFQTAQEDLQYLT